MGKNYRKQWRIIPLYVAEYKVVDKMLIDVDKRVVEATCLWGNELTNNLLFPFAFGFQHILLEILKNNIGDSIEAIELPSHASASLLS